MCGSPEYAHRSGNGETSFSSVDVGYPICSLDHQVAMLSCVTYLCQYVIWFMMTLSPLMIDLCIQMLAFYVPD